MYGGGTDYDGGGGGGGGGASLFSGGGFMPSQATQAPESSFSSSRGTQALLPLTVKQIIQAYEANEDKSNFVVDGVEATNVKLLGRVTNTAERITEFTFTLDDCTGRIEIKRWLNETSDSAEVSIIQNGMYVSINGTLKGFQGKKQVVAFSVRPLIDFNDITCHFLECIHVHLENTRPKVQGGPLYQATGTPARNEVRGYQAPVSNQFPVNSGPSGSHNDINKLVLDVFQEPESLAPDNGLHVNDVIRRLGIPRAKIMEAIAYHVDVGNIYSTIDDDHYKSACNG